MGLLGLASFVSEQRTKEIGIRKVMGSSVWGIVYLLSNDFNKIVLVSPPSDLVGYSRRFARWYWMPEAVREAMQNAIEERYGVRWEDLEVRRVAPLLGNGLALVTAGDRHQRAVCGDHSAAGQAREDHLIRQHREQEIRLANRLDRQRRERLAP